MIIFNNDLFHQVAIMVSGGIHKVDMIIFNNDLFHQVAIMVSLAVFLSFINDAMPKTSSSISRLAIYVDLLLMQSCLSFLATLVVLRGHYHTERLDRLDKERTHNSAMEPGTCGLVMCSYLDAQYHVKAQCRRDLDQKR